MKLAIILLCVVAAVQGRSTSLKVVNNQRSVAALGENPWVVHLRLAVATSGTLNSCAGALIDNRWVLTTAQCVRDVRFVWIRFGAVEVIRPELVLESTAVTPNAGWDPQTGENNVALINLNRDVDPTVNIAPIGLPAADSYISDSASYCAYGEEINNAAGERLNCWDVSVVASNLDAVVVEGEGISASQFDTGAPLVSDGVLVGVLAQAGTGQNRAVFIRTSAQVNWIVGMTGLNVGRVSAPLPADSDDFKVIIVDA